MSLALLFWILFIFYVVLSGYEFMASAPPPRWGGWWLLVGMLACLGVHSFGRLVH